MKISKVIIVTLFAWVAYDSNLFRSRGVRFALSSTSISMEDAIEALREVKEVKRHKREVIPPCCRPGEPKLKMKVNHFSSKTKDPRYSDQRKIRRRFNNL